MSDPHDVLRVAHDAHAAEIDRAYRKLVRRYPPELNPRRFAEIHRAYQRLTALDQTMEQAFAQPHKALDELFPSPSARPRPDDGAALPYEPPDFDPLLHGLRRQLLAFVLRTAKPPTDS